MNNSSKESRIMDMRERVSSISIEISWREIARQYFGKSSSWLYHKLNGLDGGFSQQEAIDFKNALLDLSNRIKECANKIETEK